MTKSIKRNKTFKSKKNKKGGSRDNQNQEEIFNLITVLSKSQCSDSNMIILNHDDVNYLKTYLNNKTVKSEDEKNLSQKLDNMGTINEGCKYVLNLYHTEYYNNSSPSIRTSPSPEYVPSIRTSPDYVPSFGY